MWKLFFFNLEKHMWILKNITKPIETLTTCTFLMSCEEQLYLFPCYIKQACFYIIYSLLSQLKSSLSTEILLQRRIIVDFYCKMIYCKTCKGLIFSTRPLQSMKRSKKRFISLNPIDE